MISKELLSEVLGVEVENFNYIPDDKQTISSNEGFIIATHDSVPIINIHELAFKNLKQWAKLKNVFDIIDWSGEPEQIFAKAEELRNEIN